MQVQQSTQLGHRSLSSHPHPHPLAMPAALPTWQPTVPTLASASSCSSISNSWARMQPAAMCQQAHRKPLPSCSMQAHAQRPSASSAISRSILSVVKDEQKYALESYRKDEELLEDPPNEFELDTTPGSRVVYLLKAYRDEQIIIDMDLDDQDEQDEQLDDSEEEEDEDEDSLPPVSFRVQINKPKAQSVLAFRCSSNGQYLTILDLSLRSRGDMLQEDDDDEDEEGADDEDDDEAYEGPPFEELDDTLQQAFMDYLEERGITAELGRYLALTCLDKAATEYQAWLGRVSKFIAS